MVKTGQKPGLGTYICTICGDSVVLKNEQEALPLCPSCGATTFEQEEEQKQADG